MGVFFFCVCVVYVCLLYVCIHVPTGVYTCVCRCARLCMCLWRPEINVLCPLFSPYFLSHGLSLSMELPSSARVAGQRAAEICFPFYKMLGYRHVLLLLAFVWGVRIQTQMPTLLRQVLWSLCYPHHAGPNPKQNCSFTLCPRTFTWPFLVSLPYLPSRDSVNYIMSLQRWTEIIQQEEHGIIGSAP